MIQQCFMQVKVEDAMTAAQDIHLEKARVTVDVKEGASLSTLANTVPSSDFTFRVAAPMSLVVDKPLGSPTQSLKRPKAAQRSF
jgi:hypothetical protein